MRIRIKIFILFLFILLLTACDKEKVLIEDKSSNTIKETPAQEILNPHQFLILASENSPYLSFDYSFEIEGQANQVKGRFSRSNGKSVSTYSVMNMYDEAIDVVEILYEDHHYFVLHQFKEVYAYKVPTNHLIYDEMLWASSVEPAKIEKKEGEVVYFYEHPFIQDETMNHIYAFTMSPKGLIQMVHSLGERHLRTVYFEDFNTEELPEDSFDIPQNYGVTIFDYPFDEGQMPPWWTLKF